jgi:phenylalanine-4-hydroxylase
MDPYKFTEGMKQDYTAYSAEDQKVWQILFDRQLAQLQTVADKNFLEGIETIGFTRDVIPDFDEVNARLGILTGWQIAVVPGIIGNEDFFKLLANKRFPSSTWLRPMRSLDYLSEPDMFHDSFGHMPLLTIQAFADFYQALGELGVKYKDHPDAFKCLGRIYWFTVEFGLIQAPGSELKIYGAGILSSSGETVYCLGDIPKRTTFDIQAIMHTDFDNTKIQNEYFVVSSYEELLGSIAEIEQHLENICVMV